MPWEKAFLITVGILLSEHNSQAKIWSYMVVLVFRHWPIRDVCQVWDQDSAFNNEAAHAGLWWWISCKYK